MPVEPNTPIELVRSVYASLPERVELARTTLGRPVTFAEKALFNHLRDPGSPSYERAVT